MADEKASESEKAPSTRESIISCSQQPTDRREGKGIHMLIESGLKMAGRPSRC